MVTGAQRLNVWNNWNFGTLGTCTSLIPLERSIAVERLERDSFLVSIAIEQLERLELAAVSFQISHCPIDNCADRSSPYRW
jgi:hypothetical protein